MDTNFDLFYKYDWPGNVRELQNVIQRACLLASDEVIEVDDIPISKDTPIDHAKWVDALPIGKTMRIVETQFILATLKHHNGNRTHAARTLGISLRTLRNKINEFTAEGYEVTAPLSGRSLA